MKKVSINHCCQEACKDYLYSYISALFGKEQNLYFVSLQPKHETCVTPQQIQKQTREIFSEVNFVAVYETTNRKKKKNLRYEKDVNWHSHLIMTESDFKKMKNKFSGKDIVGKFVYYLEGLVNYLSKQADETKLLPEKHSGIQKEEEKKTSYSGPSEAGEPDIVTEIPECTNPKANQNAANLFGKVMLYVKDFITDTIAFAKWPFSKLKFISGSGNNSG